MQINLSSYFLFTDSHNVANKDNVKSDVICEDGYALCLTSAGPGHNLDTLIYLQTKY